MNNIETERAFFLSELTNIKVIFNNRKIGKLADLIITEAGKIPEITHVVVHRSFGYHSLLIPWDRVTTITKHEIIIDIGKIENYEKDPEPSMILLKDYVLDKKVVDLNDNEVDVVYDVKLVLRNHQLYASEVDFSKNGLLRRLKLKWLSDLFRQNSNVHDTLSWTYIQPLPEKIGSFSGNVKLTVLKEKITEIHPVDLANILEELDQPQRLAIFNELDTEQASDTLEEVEPRVQRELISSIKIERAAELINDMTPAQAADILAILPTADADTILALLDKESAVRVQSLLEQHDQKIINFLTTYFIKVPPTFTAGHVLNQFRQVARDKDVIMYLYVVDKSDKLLGVIDIRELVQAELESPMEDIMTSSVISLNPESTVIEATELFSRYSFRAIPVIDDNGVILGVIPYRDIMNLKHHFV